MTSPRGARRILARTAGALIAMTVGLVAMAPHCARSEVPRTIRIVVPFPAGGPTDVTARLIGEQIGKLHGVSFVVENRPGGGALIATEAVARAEPDGGTLLIAAGALLINPILKKTNYNPLTSFAPLCLLVRSPHFVVVNKESPLRSFADFFTLACRNLADRIRDLPQNVRLNSRYWNCLGHGERFFRIFFQSIERLFSPITCQSAQALLCILLRIRSPAATR